MTSIKTLREQQKRREAAMSQIKKLEKLRGLTMDHVGAPSPSKKDSITPGTKDRMPGARFGDDDHKKKRKKSNRNKLKGVI